MVHVTLFKNRLFLFGGIKFKIMCNYIHIISLKLKIPWATQQGVSLFLLSQEPYSLVHYIHSL